MTRRKLKRRINPGASSRNPEDNALATLRNQKIPMSRRAVVAKNLYAAGLHRREALAELKKMLAEPDKTFRGKLFDLMNSWLLKHEQGKKVPTMKLPLSWKELLAGTGLAGPAEYIPDAEWHRLTKKEKFPDLQKHKRTRDDEEDTEDDEG